MLNKDMDELLMELQEKKQQQQRINEEHEVLTENFKKDQESIARFQKNADELISFNQLLKDQKQELLNRIQELEREKDTQNLNSQQSAYKIEKLEKQLETTQQQRSQAHEDVKDLREQIIEEQKLSSQLKAKNNELLA